MTLANPKSRILAYPRLVTNVGRLDGNERRLTVFADFVMFVLGVNEMVGPGAYLSAAAPAHVAKGSRNG